MPLKSYKPTSPGRRLMTSPDFSEITKSRPEKKLTLPLNSTGGRNVYGRMTTRHRGGGHKQRIRIIDWKRDKDGVPAKVAAVEYDPNRSARLALLHYTDGEKRYVLGPVGGTVGQHRARDRPHRQGRPEPLEGLAAHRARPGDEPGGPPARRRRGQERPGQPAPGLAVGPADQGIQDAREQAHHEVHREAPRQGSPVMARSIKKGPFIDRHVIKKVEEMNRANQKKVVKTWSRRSTIVPELVGHTFAVHNGRKFIPLFVTE